MSIKKYFLCFIFYLTVITCFFAGVNLIHGKAEDTLAYEVINNEISLSATLSVDEPIMPCIEQPSSVRVYLSDKNDVITMDLEEYVTGVLTAEMYSDAPSEALKSMAVAARTYTLYMCDKNISKKYDVVADSNYYQGYIDEAEAVEVWGELGKSKYDEMKNAVRLTEGEVLCYNGELICALYHASSYPSTENCENVFIEKLPYLQGKKSVETIDSAYRSSVTLTFDEFNTMLARGGYPATVGNVEIINFQNSNSRCDYLQIKDESVSFTVSGREVRNVFGLRSTSFDVSIDDGCVVFSVYGYGHGVGLSQNGAVVMAKSGRSYVDILNEYYPDSEIFKTIYKQ